MTLPPWLSEVVTAPTDISDTQVLVTLFEGKAVHGNLGDL